MNDEDKCAYFYVASWLRMFLEMMFLTMLVCVFLMNVTLDFFDTFSKLYTMRRVFFVSVHLNTPCMY